MMISLKHQSKAACWLIERRCRFRSYVMEKIMYLLGPKRRAIRRNCPARHRSAELEVHLHCLICRQCKGPVACRQGLGQAGNGHRYCPLCRCPQSPSKSMLTR